MFTFLTLVQICTTCFALKEMSSIDDVYDCLRRDVLKVCWAHYRNRRSKSVKNNVVYIVACFFVFFLFSLIKVMRLDSIEADLCIVYQEEKNIKK